MTQLQNSRNTWNQKLNTSLKGNMFIISEMCLMIYIVLTIEMKRRFRILQWRSVVPYLRTKIHTQAQKCVPHELSSVWQNSLLLSGETVKSKEKKIYHGEWTIFRTQKSKCQKTTPLFECCKTLATRRRNLFFIQQRRRICLQTQKPNIFHNT